MKKLKTVTEVLRQIKEETFEARKKEFLFWLFNHLYHLRFYKTQKSKRYKLVFEEFWRIRKGRGWEFINFKGEWDKLKGEGRL